MVRRLGGWTTAFGLTLALTIGCNTGSRSNNSGGSTPTTPATVSTLTYAQVALATTQSTAQIGSEVVAMVISLSNTLGPNDLNLQSITLSTNGQLDESLTLGGVRLIRDVDGDGAFNAVTDDVVATVPSSVTTFPSDNSSVTLPLSTATTITFGAPTQQFLVLVETVPNGLGATSFVGSNINFYVAQASDIVARDGAGAQAEILGNFPITPPVNPVRFKLNDHLLISEICVLPNGAEFIEIFNPTAQTIDLTNVYLTDAVTQGVPPAGRFYWLLPSGANFESTAAGTTDFTVRFPATTLGPGAYYVVAVDGISFGNAFGRLPSAAMRNANGAAQMQTPANATAVTGSQPMLNDNVESIYLFFWDGASDLVQDLDAVNYGNRTSASNKSAQAVDGPDAGTTTSSYVTETAINGQDFVTPVPPTASPPNAMSRTDYTETGESKTNGNGVVTASGARHDEMSESVNTSFSIATANPGGP